MALLDLSLVTQTLIDLIATHVKASSSWNNIANPLDVQPLPPDKLDGDNTLGFYLYHVTEELQNKTAYIPGVSDVPVRFTSMTLNLYYVLTAHSDLENETGTLREQTMMGLAMKALHDYPVLNDDTIISGTQIMQPLLRQRENRFKIAMLPVQRDHAVDYWTAGSSPLRLSAYYHVSHALLEPEEPDVRPGRVLTYNVYAMPSLSPRIDATENVMFFTLINETDPRAIELRPAQVAYDQPFSVLGTSLVGDRLELRLRRADWANAITLDANQWNIAFGGQRISATARLNADASVIVPGIYSVSVRAERWRTGGSGTLVLDAISNEMPLIIAPRIDNITQVDVDIFEAQGIRFAHTDIDPTTIQVYLGGDRLTRSANPNALLPGEFGIVAAADATDPTDLDLLRLRQFNGAAPGIYSLRIIINGAENAPAWIQT